MACVELSKKVYFNGLLLAHADMFLQVMMNLLYFYGMCGIVKESLLRYFSGNLNNPWGFQPCFHSDYSVWILFTLLEPLWVWQEVRCNIQGLESDIVQACRRVSILCTEICTLWNWGSRYLTVWISSYLPFVVEYSLNSDGCVHSRWMRGRAVMLCALCK
jgi:hypothetical protein